MSDTPSLGPVVGSIVGLVAAIGSYLKWWKSKKHEIEREAVTYEGLNIAGTERTLDRYEKQIERYEQRMELLEKANESLRRLLYEAEHQCSLLKEEIAVLKKQVNGSRSEQ